MDLAIEDKVVVVTGGASGVGRALCWAFAEAGSNVVVADVDRKAGAGASGALKEKHGGNHLFVHTDVTRRDSVHGLIAATLGAFGQVDVLVNNAGISIPGLLVDPEGNEELTEANWDKVVAVNQKGFFLCAQAAARAMIASGKGGVIINMASESGLEGSEGQSVYAATKGAIYALTRSWAKELGKWNVRVVGVAPGILEQTAFRSEEYECALAYARGITVEQLQEAYEKASIPLGRVGTLREVAEVVCFLASARASYIHGTVVNISGGKSRG